MVMQDRVVMVNNMLVRVVMVNNMQARVAQDPSQIRIYSLAQLQTV